MLGSCGHARVLCTVLTLAPGAGACSFFSELESEESATGAETDTDTDGDGTDGLCTLAVDDYCDNQDVLYACLSDGSVEVYDCGLMCGEYVNFTCINVGTGQHGCWCVSAGKQKVYSCVELEDCLDGCGNTIDSACSNQCFSRTTDSTVRMYGALVHCAQSSCEATCGNDPNACAGCWESVISGQSGGCGLERSVCDADRNDESWP